jgi:hypothetical protein
MSAVVFAEFVAVMPAFNVRFPAPARILIFAVELVKVSVPAVTLVFTVVLPTAEKVALSPDPQAAPAEPVHQVLPPVQLPLPPAVLVPALLQVTFAASRFHGQERKISEIKNEKTLAREIR